MSPATARSIDFETVRHARATSMMQPKRQPGLDPSGNARTVAARDSAALQCLVVSTDEARRESLAWSARDGGWQTTICADTDSALERARWTYLQLAIVDLTSPSGSEPPGFRHLVERL